LSLSFSHAFLAGNLQALELSSNLSSLKKASKVASSSSFALVFPFLEKKKLASSISLSPSTI